MGRSRLGSELEMKNWVMEIADAMIPVMKERCVDSEGHPFRYMSVHDLSVDYDFQGEVHQITASIHYLTEGEDFTEDVIIRYFDSIYNYTLELSQYDRLLARTNFFGNIEPVDRIYMNEEDGLIVYKAPQGVHIMELGLSDEMVAFQCGVIMGILHGGDTSILDLERYKDLSAYLIYHMPFTDETKERLIDGLAEEFSLITHSYAGYEPVSHIDLDHIRFAPLEDNMTKAKILNGDAFYIEVMPILVTHPQMDRMEDFANLFAERGFIEYQKTGKVYDTVTMLIACMEGYEGYFEQYSSSPMDRIYPEGLSLDLHMTLAIWMIALKFMEAAETINLTILSEYSEFVLKKTPFKIYDHI
ncbi:MAG: hypothetical protein ACXAE3_06725 [Candidatus Kariarchaeaceae archaeon]